MKIIVNHLTRMRPGYICVAGLDVATGRHVRPVLDHRNLGTALLARHGGPFDIGAQVDLERTHYAGQPPETEDYHFEPRYAQRQGYATPGEFWAWLDRVAQPHLREIFGPALSLQGQGCVVAPGTGTTSLGCLRALRPPLLRLTEQGRIRCLLPSRTGTLDLGVTDLRLYSYEGGQYQPRPAVIAQVAARLERGVQAILSVGLGRPWQKLDGSAPLHWLQVNNLHLADDPLWRYG
jgi:hypothetical protein